ARVYVQAGRFGRGGRGGRLLPVPELRSARVGPTARASVRGDAARADAGVVRSVMRALPRRDGTGRTIQGRQDRAEGAAGSGPGVQGSETTGDRTGDVVMAYGIGTDYAHGERMDPPETGEDGDADTEKGDQVTDITDRARDLADKLRATSRHYNKLIDWEEHDLSDDQAAVLILAELQAERSRTIEECKADIMAGSFIHLDSPEYQWSRTICRHLDDLK